MNAIPKTVISGSNYNPPKNLKLPRHPTDATKIPSSKTVAEQFLNSNKHNQNKPPKHPKPQKKPEKSPQLPHKTVGRATPLTSAAPTPTPSDRSHQKAQYSQHSPPKPPAQVASQDSTDQPPPTSHQYKPPEQYKPKDSQIHKQHRQRRHQRKTKRRRRNPQPPHHHPTELLPRSESQGFFRYRRLLTPVSRSSLGSLQLSSE